MSSADTNEQGIPVTGSNFSGYLPELPASYRGEPTWTITPLNYNAGYGKQYSATATDQAASLVGGDINRDGVINELDVEEIRNAASMSFNPRTSLKGYMQPANAIDRTIVDRNRGKSAD